MADSSHNSETRRVVPGVRPKNFVTLTLVTAALAAILQAQTVVVENLVDVVPNSFTVGEVADVDADGHLDLVLSGGRIRWGQAAGFSGAVQALDPTSGSRALMVADFNGDNLPDIAAGWDQSPEVHLFWNRGNRVFEVEFIDSTRGTNWLVAVDVDEDGVLDLVSADRLESGEVVWYRKGETEWVAETIAASLTQPYRYEFSNDLRIWSSSYRAGNRLIQIEEQTSSNGLPIFGLLPLPTGDEFYFRVIGVREVE